MRRQESPTQPAVSRRTLLSGLAVGGTLAATHGAGLGLAQSSATPSSTGGTVLSSPVAEISAFQEAPMLTEQVTAGALPPVQERLPKNPLVVTPVESIGQYGGTWNTALTGGSDTPWLSRTIGMENLVRWAEDCQSVIPNLAELVTVSADATRYEFKLREGIRWSDGEPFDADDIMFWYEAVDTNPELTPGRGTNPPTVEKIDRYTVAFVFAEPYGLFLQQIVASADGDVFTHCPKHYLQQFHKDYADPAALDQLIEDNGADSWVQLFQTKGGVIPGTPADARWQNPELPTLFGWKITEPYGTGARVRAERNPFYWKVDPEGNQLPYLDSVVYNILEDSEVLLLKAASGEIDMQDRNVGEQLKNKPVLADARESGGFHFFDVIFSRMNVMIVALNQNHKNPVLRELFQNKDFRIGLSYAINRQEIIDTIFVGQGEPWQAGPQRETPFFNEQLATQYTEYNVDLANEYLDKVAPERDGEGFRLDPNGKKISFQVEAASNTNDKVDGMGLVSRHWKDVGIDCQVKPEDRSLFTTRKESNDHDGTTWWGTGGLEGMITPIWYFPYNNNSDFAQAWQTWYNNPSGDGASTPPEEPPAPIKKQMELYDQLKASGDSQKQIELFSELLQIAADEFHVIGLCTSPPGFGVVTNHFHNVPESMISGGLYSNPSQTNPCQYFVEPSS